MNATFGARASRRQVLPGLVVQSGGVGIALLEHLGGSASGVSSFASVGDKYDVSSNDMLTWWEQDDQTTIAMLYVESFGNPRAFARTARRVSAKLPVLTVIGGRSAAGQRAAASHTAAAATPLVTQEALFGQAGSSRPQPGRTGCDGRLPVLPAAAGRPPASALSPTRAGPAYWPPMPAGTPGLTVAGLDAGTQRRLAHILPPGSAVSGPVDTTATVTATVFRAALEAVGADPSVDVVLAIAVPTAIADLRTAICAAAPGLPMAAVLLGQAESVALLPGRATTAAGTAPAGARRIPAYGYPERRRPGHRLRGRLPRLAGPRPRHGAGLTGIDSDGARKLIAAFLTAFPRRRLALREGRGRAADQLPDPAGALPLRRRRGGRRCRRGRARRPRRGQGGRARTSSTRPPPARSSSICAPATR